MDIQPLRDEARHAVRVYLSKTGLTLEDFAERTGYAYNYVKQFLTAGPHGNGDGSVAAETLIRWMAENPPLKPPLPGRLYPTKGTRKMDELLSYISAARWGILYGPSGSQKSFYLEYAAALDPESKGYIYSSPSGMTPVVLLSRIAALLGAPYARYTDSLRQSIIYTLGKRRKPFTIILDEAQHLYHFISTIETLREIGDWGRGRVGILIAGNERVKEIFEPRRKVYFAQWRGRVNQMEVEVLGPSREEARGMIAGELGEYSPAKTELMLDETTEKDPVSHKEYISTHPLFLAIRDVLAIRAKRAN
jgi:hypothetical protein